MYTKRIRVIRVVGVAISITIDDGAAGSKRMGWQVDVEVQPLHFLLGPLEILSGALLRTCRANL